jgi:hypothetical protein
MDTKTTIWLFTTIPFSLTLGCGNETPSRNGTQAVSSSRGELLHVAGGSSAGGSTEVDISPLALLPGYESIYRATAPGNSSLIGTKGVTSSKLPSWTNQRGTTSNDVAMGIAAAFDGTIFTAGYTHGGLDGNTNGGFARADVVVMSHTPAGVHQWTRQVGGSAHDYATDISIQCNPVGTPTCSALHVSGYSAGAFDGNTFAGGTSDAIIIKYNLSGTKVWSRQLGSTAADQGTAIASDAAGNSYLVGYTHGVLPGGSAAGSSGSDAFIAKYDTNGIRLWLRQFGTPFSDQAQAVAVDSEGNPYVGGLTFGDMDGAGPGTHQGTSDAFVVKFDSNGNRLWTRQAGTPQQEAVMALAASKTASTNIFSAGWTQGSFAGAHAGNNDGFVVNYGTDGTEIWRRQFGTAGVDYVHGIASDGGTNLYLTGESNYNLNTGAANPDSLDFDTFLGKYDKTGALVLAPETFNQLDSATAKRETGHGVAADFDSGVYIAGRTSGKVGANHFGQDDILVYRYGDGCTTNSSLDLCRPGGGWGDPHLTTFDGIAYDFQGAGEFVLVEATTGSPFTIQARQSPWGSSNRVTVYTGAAAAVGADRVALYTDRSPALWVNGAPATLGINQVLGLPGGGRVYRRVQGNRYVVAWPSGERLVADVIANAYMNLQVLLPSSRQGQMHGLYGNYNGSRQDDFALRDGTQLPQPLSFSEMYGPFADSWRITQEESLFDYLPGETTDTFTIRPFPASPAYVTTLPPAQRAAAEAVCNGVGANNPALFESCVVDVAITGDSGFADTAAGVEEQAASVGNTEPPESVSRGAYFANFDDAVGVEWSRQITETAPSGTRTFLGPFADETVSLSITDLQPHTSITMSFDVVIAGGWDGEGPLGPHFWGVSSADGSVFLNTTFSNTSSLQSYPGEYPGFNLPGTGAAETSTLFYEGGDSVYSIVFSFPHTGSTFDLSFFAAGLASAEGASWGLDNVDIQVH